MIRGEIWLASLIFPSMEKIKDGVLPAKLQPSPGRHPWRLGSEPAKRRPVLVIQGDIYNRSEVSTVICVVITSNLNLAKAPPNFILEKGVSGLDKTSVINFSQMYTIDKSFFIQQISMLPKYVIAKVDMAVRQMLEV
jgi:mRNA interferase MazF